MEPIRLLRRLTNRELTVCTLTILRHFTRIEKVHPEHPLCGQWNGVKIRRILDTATCTNRLEAYVDSEGLLVGFFMYDVGQPWWSANNMISELGVYTVNQDFHGFGRIAAQRLNTLARQHGCTIIEAGAAVTKNSKLLENTYKKIGPVFLYPTFLVSAGS